MVVPVILAAISAGKPFTIQPPPRQLIRPKCGGLNRPPHRHGQVRARDHLYRSAPRRDMAPLIALPLPLLPPPNKPHNTLHRLAHLFSVSSENHQGGYSIGPRPLFALHHAYHSGERHDLYGWDASSPRPARFGSSSSDCHLFLYDTYNT
jgi:hypothetical protein